MNTLRTTWCFRSGLLVLILAVLGLALANLKATEVISALNGERDPLTMVTGFHSITQADSPFHMRVLEANGEATVAINPIALFFVVTNDSSAGDLQQHIWRLPLTVTHVKNVTGIKSGIRILAVLQAVPNAGIKERELSILVRYNTSSGLLKDTITVDRE